MKSKKGATLIELTFVVFIMGILFSMGMPLYVNIQKDGALEAEARDMIGAFSRARQQSIKEGIPVYVYPVNLDDAWTNGWIIYANERTIQHDSSSIIDIENTDSINSLKFDPRGRVFDGGTNNPINEVSFLICDVDNKDLDGRKVSINFLGKITTSYELC
jgi:Tfp pilus assembly protein FimT